MERDAQAYVRLKKACLPLIVAVQELAGSNLLSGDLQVLLEELRDAIRGAAREELVESLPIVTLPLYTIITTPAPQARPGKYQEVKTVAWALECVECAARQCGPSFIDGDPSIFLKFLTHLTLRLATLSGEDSSKSVEWSTEERATLATVRALCECRGPLKEPQQRDAGGASEGWDSGTKWTEVLRALVGAVNGAIVAQAIQAILDIAAKDKDRDMRLLALSTLSSLLELLPCPDLWRPFFPGVFGGLAKLVMGDFKQGSKLTSTALAMLLKTTALLTSDDVLRALPQSQAGQPLVAGGGATGASTAPPAWLALCAKLSPPQAPCPCPLPTLQLPIPPKLALPVTRAWVEELCKRLSDFMPLVLRASRESPSAQVRLELVQGLSLLLRSSRLFLRTSGPLLRDVVDSVVGLQRDDVEAVARAAAELLPECLDPTFLVAASPSWLVDRLLELFTCLPRLAVSANDAPLRSALDLLAGYLSLVAKEGPGGRTMQQLLSTHLDALLASLTQTLAFERSLNLQVIDPLAEQQQGQERARPAMVGYYRHSFVHVREERCLKVVKDVLHLLGTGGGAEGAYVLVDRVLERVRGRRPKEVGARLEWAMDRLPLIFLLNHVILGAGKQPQSLLPALRLLLEELLRPGGGSVWRLRTCQEVGEEEAGEQEGEGAVALPAGVLDANGALVALLVETVGNAAQALGAEGFRPLLSLVLYPVLEKMGHGHPVVRQAALTTAHRLALITGAGSIQRLVSLNLDYLVDALCARVRRSQAGGRRGAFPVRAGVLECLMTYTHTEQGQGEGAAMSLVREVAGLALSVVDVDGRTGGGQRYVNGMMRVLHAMVRNVKVTKEGEGGSAAAQASRGRKRRRRGAAGACRADAMAFWTQQIAAEFAGPREAAPQEDGPEGKSAADYFTALHEKNKTKAQAEGGDEELEADRLLEAIKKGAEGGEEGEEEDEEEDDKPTEAGALLIDILDRCAYFISSPSLLVQQSVLGVMVEALQRLQGRRVVLLPSVHRLWPSLLARLRHCAAILQPVRRPGVNEEHSPDSQVSSAQLVLIKVLDMVGCLAVLCGDYMSLKFSEELWPLLRRLLAAYQTRRATAGLLTADSLRSIGAGEEPMAMLRGGASDKTSSTQAALVTRKTRPGLQVQGLLALLRCLCSFCESEACYMYTTPLVHDMGLACLFLLGRDETQGSHDAVRLFKALLRLDGASLWPALMAVSGCDVSARPLRWQTPLSTATAPLPGLRDSGVQAWDERERGLAQGLAKALVIGMQDRTYRETAWCTRTA